MRFKPCAVTISPFAEKQLNKIPLHIKEHVYLWIDTVENVGIDQTRKLPGYRDKPLCGDRSGQRSVRLNKSYRLFYKITTKPEVQIIGILEINKHDY